MSQDSGNAWYTMAKCRHVLRTHKLAIHNITDIWTSFWGIFFPKKPKKRQWQTGYLPRPPTSPYRSQSLHAGWPPVWSPKCKRWLGWIWICSSIFQVLLKSVQWFCRCGWSKIALPHYFGQWLIQQLVLPYKLWCVPKTSSFFIFRHHHHHSSLLWVVKTQLNSNNSVEN